MREIWRWLPLLFAVAFATLAGAQLTASSNAETFGSAFRDADTWGIAKENTSGFGWEPATFERGANNNLVEGPSLALGGDFCLPGSLNQIETADFIYGSNGILLGVNGPTETLSLSLSTSSLPGLAGFTAIIIQGLTLGGAPAANSIVNYQIVGRMDGVFSSLVLGWSANTPAPNHAQGEWWIEHEFLGNGEVYSLKASFTNVRPDAGLAVPEPSVGKLALASLALIAWLRRETISKVFVLPRCPRRRSGRDQNKPAVK